jgi:hypothetical protein
MKASILALIAGSMANLFLMFWGASANYLVREIMHSEGNSILNLASFIVTKSIWGPGEGVDGVIIEAYTVPTCLTMQSSMNRLALCLESPDIPSNVDEFAYPIKAPTETVPAPHGRSDMRDQSALALALASALGMGTGMFAALLFLS